MAVFETLAMVDVLASAFARNLEGERGNEAYQYAAAGMDNLVFGSNQKLLNTLENVTNVVRNAIREKRGLV